MAKYTKTTPIGGKWAKGSDLVNVKRAKIVSETTPMPSSFTNKDGSPKTQDVCKVKFEGIDDTLNASLNRATINGLIEAFGEDSRDWMNKILSVETEKVKVSGKSTVAIYLIPDGFEKVDDANGYTVIVKKGEIAEASEVNTDDIPF